MLLLEDKWIILPEEEPLMYQMREFVPEQPGDAYLSKTTGCAGREDEYDD